MCRFNKYRKNGLKSLAVAALAVLLSMTAWAIDLHSAKSQGLVGETESGYLAAVASPSQEVSTLIREVNLQRRKEYERIARENGIALSDVEALAGKKAIEKTPSGQFVKLGGAWRTK